MRRFAWIAEPRTVFNVLRLWGVLLVMAQALSACATLPPPPPRQASQALADPLSTTLGQRAQAAQPARGWSGFRVVTAGTDALAVLMLLADESQRTLDLQYYIVENEPSTRALLQHVRAAADRGVRVRLLVDDLHTSGNDDALRRLTEHPRIEVRLYNPLPAGRFSTFTKLLGSAASDMQRINRRMHNKMFVADNALAFTGGRNLGDAYFLQSDKANFVDMDLLVAGPAVQALSRSFDRYWNSPLAYPVAALVPAASPPSSALLSPPLDAPAATQPLIGLPPDAAAREIAPGGRLRLQWAPARLLADDPAKIEAPANLTPEQSMFDDVLSLLRSARHEVLIISPYLVPGPRGMALFTELRRRGVRVRILTSSLAATDAPVVHIGYAHYREAMLELGVELYELRPRIGEPNGRFGAFGQSQARLHAKALTVDGHHLLIGSMNLDPRSIDLNSEIALQIASPALAGELKRLFDETVATSSYRVERTRDGRLRWTTIGRDGAPIVETAEPESSFWRRLGLWLMAPIAPEEML
jgi:phosphatidylserine/phosphatidylglycerophosphate/cardiolipin synthase-like enzyme